jgi:hypothetical protein
MTSEPVPASSVAPRVLVINFDPIVHTHGGRPLHEVCGWHDPRTLMDGYIADLAACSGGYVRYEIIDWRDVDAYPVKQDGFR